MATGRVPTTANSPLTAKGDLFGYSTTQARVPVGSDGETLVADSSTSTGLRWQGNFAAGKNKFLNSDFSIWQRGTSFTLSSGVDTYCADRFTFAAYGSGTAGTATRQTFTPGTAPVAGYEGQFFGRITNFATASAWQFRQRIENVQTFAGQTITFSFWAKASTSITASVEGTQNFGSGGSTANGFAIGSASLTTSWTRFSYTYTIPSIAGKTIGTSSFLELSFYQGAGATNSSTIDTWGWQVENGNTATAFQTATGTLAGELAACQRYYYRQSIAATPSRFGLGYASSTTAGVFYTYFPVQMRTAPTALEQSGTAGDYSIVRQGTTIVTCSAVPLVGSNSVNVAQYSFTVASGLTAGEGIEARPVNTNAYLGWSAEL